MRVVSCILHRYLIARYSWKKRHGDLQYPTNDGFLVDVRAYGCVCCAQRTGDAVCLRPTVPWSTLASFDQVLALLWRRAGLTEVIDQCRLLLPSLDCLRLSDQYLSQY